ncbi:MAG: hypothetical protein ACTH6N_10315 [Brachybacterium tyrofermentans]
MAAAAFVAGGGTAGRGVVAGSAPVGGPDRSGVLDAGEEPGTGASLAADSEGSADGAEGAPPGHMRFGLAAPNALSRFLRASSGGMGVDSTRRTGS